MSILRPINLIRYITILLISLQLPLHAQHFELKNEDRVVFLGNSLFENENYHNYLEYALTTRWPERSITFRNIGWTGDNVFGEARSYITNPPTPYELLIKQLTDAKPTVVFIAYGGIESQKGKEGLAEFNKGMAKLLEKVAELKAQAILLSPIPVFLQDQERNAAQNANLQLYTKEIASIAKANKLPYVDLYTPLQNVKTTAPITDNGIHLNQLGYYHLANILEKGLGLPARRQDIRLSSIAAKNTTSSVKVEINSSAKKLDNIQVVVPATSLPLLAPASQLTDDNKQSMVITDLKKGIYALHNEGELVAVASAEEWAKGVDITQGIAFQKAKQLHQYLFKKSDIFFQQYRPLNRTYIVGFRKYEQGRHQQGLEDMNILITWIEAQISTLLKPAPQTFQLTLVK